MRAAWFVVVLSIAGCVSSGRFDRLERRMAAAEAAQAKSEFELRASLARLEAMLGTLAGSVDGASDAAAKAEELRVQLEKLAAEVDAALVALPALGGPQPDATKTYGVPVVGFPVKGKATALVTIVRAGEYACPFCEKVRGTLDQISTTYGDQVRIVYRQYVVHPQVATYASQAACAANHQGKFWDLDTLLWDEAFGLSRRRRRARQPRRPDMPATAPT
jgi:protein-disulfide isomerase